MSLATQGSTIKKPIYPTPTGNSPKVTGVLAPSKTSLSAPQPTPTPQSTQAIKIPMASGVNQTIQQDAQGNKYAAPKSNPSVLEQQKALNKLGAGLVEDGIAGDKTRAAIAKYGSSGTPTGTTSGVIKPSTTSTPEQRDSKGLLVNPVGATYDRNTGQKIVTPPEPPKIDTQSNAERVIDSGQQTQNERDTQARLIELSRNPSEEYNQAQGIYKGYLDKYNKLLQDQQKSLAAIGQEAIPLQFQQGRQQVLQNQYAGQIAGAGSALGAATTGLGAANTQQGLQQGAASTAYGGAQTQAGRAQSGATTVLGGSLNQQGSYGVPAFNPLTGQFSGGGQYGTGPEASVNVQSIRDAQGQINNIDQSSTAINNSLSQAIDYAKSANLTGSTGILAGIQQAISAGVVTNNALVAFNQAIASVNEKLTLLGEQPINPEDATIDKLTQAQETIRKNLLTKKTGYQDFINNFNKGTSSSSGSSSGGGFAETW